MIQIKNIFDSLRDDVLSGKMTLKEAAAELRSLKKAAAESEKALEEAEAELARLEDLMCAADFYDDQEQSGMVLAEYTKLKDRIAVLTDEWEEKTLAWEEASTED